MEALLPPREKKRGRRPKSGERSKHQVGKPCAYCDTYMTEPTRDHVLPRSRGYSLKDNKVWCCGPCNRHKGSRTLPEWLEALEKKPELHKVRITKVKAVIFQRRQAGLPTHLPPIMSCVNEQIAE